MSKPWIIVMVLAFFGGWLMLRHIATAQETSPPADKEAPAAKEAPASSASADDKDKQEESAVDTEKADQPAPPEAPAALNFTVKTNTGQEVKLHEKYQGQVVLVVNVASKCGYTKQYADLQAVHEKYADRGLAILAFPCNQFGKQEPGSNEDIRQFCTAKFGVTFDLFDKIDVNGENASPLYAYLTSEKTGLSDTGKISWNFEKFLIDRQGKVIARFRSKVNPSSPAMTEAIEAALGPPAEKKDEQPDQGAP